MIGMVTVCVCLGLKVHYFDLVCNCVHHGMGSLLDVLSLWNFIYELVDVGVVTSEA